MVKPKIVITGFGAISPLGIDSNEFWQKLCQGESGIDKISAFDASGFTCQIAGEAPAFKIRDYVPKTYRKATKLMSRDIELSVVAANEAFENAGLVTKYKDPDNMTIDPKRAAITFGAGLISCELEELSRAVGPVISDGKFDIHRWGSEGINGLTPLWLLKYLPNMLPCHVGIIHDIQGPSNTITCGEASSLIAIIEASQVIQRNDADIALAGGGESKVNPLVLTRQCLIGRATAEGNDDPQSACRPFDAKATGSVFGEAAAAVILENVETAKNRNANILASIEGMGISNSLNAKIYHLEPSGEAVRIAVEKAIAQAGINAGDIDLIVPHGIGVGCDDMAEAKGIQDALGDAVKDIPVMPIKSLVSNTGAASGGLDVIAAICAMRDSVIPAVGNFESAVDGCQLKINTEKTEKKINYVLCTSYTFGGQTAAVVLKSAEKL